MDDANKIIEKAVGELYRGYFKLREAKEYQEEYDAMGTLMNMLMKDRDNLRMKYKVNP